MALFGCLKREKRRKTEDEKDREREENYYKIINEAAEKEMNFEIGNATESHTTYILKTLFRHAKNEVCLFIKDKLRGEIFGEDLILEVVNFLNKHEAKFKITYRGNKDDFLNAKFIKEIINASSKDKIEMWDGSKIAIIAEDCQFCLNDRHQFNFVKGSRGAIANFGNKEVGQNLANLFIRTIIKSERVLS